MASSPINLTTTTLNHTNPITSTLHIALYRSISLGTAIFLREQLLAGNTAFEYALIDAQMLISTSHVLAAAFRAVHAAESGKLRSRNVHAETVLSLSPNNNIASALKSFGISDKTRDLLVVKVGGAEIREAVEEHVRSVIEGERVQFVDEEIARMTNWEAVGKAYKLGVLPPAMALKSLNGGGRIVNGDSKEDPKTSQWKQDAEVIAIAMMALRGS